MDSICLYILYKKKGQKTGKSHLSFLRRSGGPTLFHELWLWGLKVTNFLDKIYAIYNFLFFYLLPVIRHGLRQYSNVLLSMHHVLKQNI